MRHGLLARLHLKVFLSLFTVSIRGSREEKTFQEHGTFEGVIETVQEYGGMSYFVSSSCTFSWIRCSTSRPIPGTRESTSKVTCIRQLGSVTMWSAPSLARRSQVTGQTDWTATENRAITYNKEQAGKDGLTKEIKV